MKFLLAAFVTLLPVALVHGLFEEQAGIIDWHKENLGRITHAQFAYRGRERLFVGSKAGAVASLDTKDGSIAWRQVLETQTPIDDMLLVPKPASVLTLSNGNSLLRAWQAADGALLWQKSLAGSSSGKGRLLVLQDPSLDASSKIAVYSGNRIEVLTALQGKRVWVSENIGEILSVSHGDGADSTALMLAVRKDSASSILKLDARTGEQLSAIELPVASNVVLSAQHVALVTGDSQIVTFSRGGKQIGKTSLQALGVSAASPQSVQFVTANTVSLASDEGLVLVDASSAKLSPQDFPGMQIIAAVGKESQEVVLAGITKSGDLEVSTYNVGSGKRSKLSTVKADLVTSSGQPLQVRSVSVGTTSAPSSDGHGLRIGVEVSDDSFWLLEAGAVKWTSEQGLGSIVSTVFVDLPASTADVVAKWASSRPTLADRLNAEVLTLKGALGYNTPEDNTLLKDINARMSTSLLPYRDANGFRKLITSLTASGKLFGLHSGRGDIVWQATLDKGIPLTRLLHWQTPFDPSVGPRLVAIGSASGQTRLVVVDAHSGEVLSEDTLPGNLIKVLQLSHVHLEKLEQQVLGLVFDDLSVKIWPESAASQMALHLPVHFWVSQGETLAGYRLDSWQGIASKTWESVYSAPHNQLLKLVVPDPHEAIYSYAKVLGNRDMKLKYLNSNLVFVIAGTETSSVDTLDSSLTVQLIDTITGQVLYSQSLQGARGPAAGVWSENWVVYSYFSIANQRYEVAVLEFYEAQPRPLSIPSLLFGQQNSSYSSFTPVSLQVLHQSYWSQTGIRTLSVTSTRKGITSKQILVGTETNQVYLLDKRFVDPRRPRGQPTKEEQAEMLPPYNEELVFNPSQYATHKEIIEGLSAIATEPANLESTTLAVVYGLDLFFTRIQPSKTFDLLPDEFPYAMLVLVSVSLLVGSLVLRRINARKVIKQKWS